MIELSSAFLHWILFGTLLIGLELFIGTAFLLWIGIAACAVGLVNAIIPCSFSIACGIFSLFSIALLVFGRKITEKFYTEIPPSTLNSRGQSMIGRVLTLSHPIVNGVGQTVVGDSVWRVIGPDLPEFSVVEVVGIKGNSLVVILKVTKTP